MDSSTLDDIEVKRNLDSSKVCCIDEDEAVKLENRTDWVLEDKKWYGWGKVDHCGQPRASRSHIYRVGT